MNEPTRDAEIARARTVLRIARGRVNQEIAVYGKAHVSKLSRRRYVEATERLNWLLGL